MKGIINIDRGDVLVEMSKGMITFTKEAQQETDFDILRIYKSGWIETIYDIDTPDECHIFNRVEMVETIQSVLGDQAVMLLDQHDSRLLTKGEVVGDIIGETYFDAQDMAEYFDGIKRIELNPVVFVERSRQLGFPNITTEDVEKEFKKRSTHIRKNNRGTYTFHVDDFHKEVGEMAENEKEQLEKEVE